MTKAVVQRPQADADIDGIFEFLSRRSRVAALRFLDTIETAYAMLAEHPASGSTRHAEFCPELPYPLRFHCLSGVPRILIYYMDRPVAVEVIRVWDAARGLDALLEQEGRS